MRSDAGRQEPAGDASRSSPASSARQSDVAQGQGQERRFGALQAASEVGLDLVADQAGRAPGGQAFAGETQNRAEELAQVWPLQDPVQPRALRGAGPAHAANGVEHHLRAAQLEEGAVAKISGGRLGQQANGATLVDEALQRLAGLVPVDQEDDARAEDRPGRRPAPPRPPPRTAR